MTTEERLTALEQGHVQTRAILESMDSKLGLILESLTIMRQELRQDNQKMFGVLTGIRQDNQKIIGLLESMNRKMGEG